LLGDSAGNIVHLFERDCSVQRRYQKVVEQAPAPNLNEEVRQKILADAKKLAASVNYRCVQDSSSISKLTAAQERGHGRVLGRRPGPTCLH
jgi:pyruvate carboxylase